MIERKGYRFRLYPTPEQAALFRRTAGCCRYLYNLALEQRSRFSRKGRNISYRMQAAEMTRLKAEAPFLREPPHHCLQQALRDLDRAFTNFFDGRASYPTPRLHSGRASFRFPDPKQFRLEAGDGKRGFLFLPKAGRVVIRLHGQIAGEIKNITISREGDWWVASLQTERDVAAPASRCDDAIVGMDLGVARPLVLSTGEFIDLPKTTPRERERERRLRRSLARKKRGSRNRLKARRALARHLAARARRRKDAIEKATTRVARKHGVVAMEDLAVRNMTASARGTVSAPGKNVRQKAGLNRSILDVSFGAIRVRLGQKLAASGGRLILVPAPYTSQRCNGCGHVAKGNRPDRDSFRCLACGHESDADLNAARNIRDAGARILDGATVGGAVLKEKSAEGLSASACGDASVSIATCRNGDTETSAKQEPPRPHPEPVEGEVGKLAA